MKQLPLYTAIASISLLSACSGGSSQGAIDQNQAPVVKVVDDITGTVGRSLILDASSSYDPEGAQVDVSWALTRTPNNANPMLDLDGDRIVITPDLPGIYKIDVIVSVARVKPVTGGGPVIKLKGVDIGAPGIIDWRPTWGRDSLATGICQPRLPADIPV